MKHLALLVGALFLTGATPAPHQGPTRATLTWFGQSAFALRSPAGKTVIMDPAPAEVGATMDGVQADVITISHEHFDHIAIERISGKPKVLRGLSPDQRRWEPIDVRVGDIQITSVGTYHDDQGGRIRGKNVVFVFETGGMRIAHLGDLGHRLTAEQASAIGVVDVLLVPVGGTFTIDAAVAHEVADQLAVRQLVIPMHFRTPAMKMKLPLSTVEPFLRGADKIERIGKPSVEISPQRSGRRVVVLDPAGG